MSLPVCHILDLVLQLFVVIAADENVNTARLRSHHSSSEDLQKIQNIQKIRDKANVRYLSIFVFSFASIEVRYDRRV